MRDVGVTYTRLEKEYLLYLASQRIRALNLPVPRGGVDDVDSDSFFRVAWVQALSDSLTAQEPKLMLNDRFNNHPARDVNKFWKIIKIGVSR